jgi:hypothetical protein
LSAAENGRTGKIGCREVDEEHGRKFKSKDALIDKL